MEVGLAAVINALGLLSAVVVILVSFKPGWDKYFRRGILVLEEVDDIIDAVLLVFPASKSLTTLDDILEKVIAELKQAGYEVNGVEKQKIKNRLKARLKREGIQIELTAEADDYELKLD